MNAAIAAGILVAAGVYLLLQRGLIRVILGFVLLGHAANVIVVAAGGMRWRGAPLLADGDVDQSADPLPQAFVLTAIVITFGLTIYLLALARAGGDDDPGPDTVDPDAPDPLDDAGDEDEPATADGEAAPDRPEPR